MFCGVEDEEEHEDRAASPFSLSPVAATGRGHRNRALRHQVVS